jgi:hypothetical protein
VRSWTATTTTTAPPPELDPPSAEAVSTASSVTSSSCEPSSVDDSSADAVVEVVSGAAVVVVSGATVVGASVDGGGMTTDAVGVVTGAGSEANDTGTMTSWPRSPVRVWSLRVTIAQRTRRQSTVGLSVAEGVMETANEPPGP